MRISKAFQTFMVSWASKAKAAFDIRDVFLFGGLGVMGYGLHLYQPWIAFVVVGACMMFIGLVVWGMGFFIKVR